MFCRRILTNTANCSSQRYSRLRKLQNIVIPSSPAVMSLAYCLDSKNQGNNAGEKNSLSRNQEAIVYVHWPFCKKLCTFCNFNKYVRDNVEHRRMRDCLVKECRTLLKLSGAEKIKSVYFGGGTPSLAEPATMFSVLECIRQGYLLADNAEITIEANPTSSESLKLREFKQAGINRLSIGIQTLNKKDLALLGREGSVSDLFKSIELARGLFPGRVSIDLLFGRPNQTLEDWSKELEQIVPVCDNHVSLYQLTLHRGTKLHQQVKTRKLAVPEDDVTADLYLKAVEVLQKAGFSRYEVSNFAKPGAESQHNKAYWEGTSYIGVGPGAHGRFYQICSDGNARRFSRVQTLEPNAWMTEVEQFGHATRIANPQTNYEVLEELIMLGLRTVDGIPNERFRQFGICAPLLDVFSNCSDVTDFVTAGLLEIDKRRMRVTSHGIPVVDSLTPSVVLHLEEYFKRRAEKHE